MSIAVKKRPVVLVVEDDFLLRMDAVEKPPLGQSSDGS
jgi:hypothetical protein